ncbi:MAG TPA: S-layer homology domain-containing protein [Negativicutes bacterium]
MKKSLAIGLIVLLMLAVTGTAFAASASFSDVPSKHWAYDAVTKLAQAGLIDGYGDGTFRGDKTMSRYEFAIIIEKAMNRYEAADEANKKLIDGLSAEFASELNRMGARITKLEAKTNITVGGDTRIRFLTDNPSVGKKLRGSDNFDFRQRIKFSGPINENMFWTSRVSTNYGNKIGNTDSSYGSTMYLDIMNITAKNILGFDSLRVGRSALDVFGNGLIGKPMAVDGILLNKTFGDVKFRGWTGNIKSNTNQGTGLGDSGNANQLTTGELAFKLADNLTVRPGYYWADIPGTSTAAGTGTLNTNVGSFTGSKGWSTAVEYKLGKYTLLGDYISTTLNNSTGLPSNPKGWMVELTNGKKPPVYYSAVNFVNPAKVGTDAWLVSYRSLDAGAVPSGAGGLDTTGVAYPTNSYSAFTHATDNVNVLYLAYENVVAKNVILSLEFQDFKIKNKGLTNLSSNDLDKTYMMKLEFFY